MANIERSIDVDAPLEFVFEKFRDFESFPRFMGGIEEVRRKDDLTLEWRAEVDGRQFSWEEIIVQEIEHERIVWRSASGPSAAGVVTFLPLNDTTTTVMLQIDYEPQSFVEEVGRAVTVEEQLVDDSLDAFKQMVEGKHAGSGWHDPVER